MLANFFLYQDEIEEARHDVIDVVVGMQVGSDGQSCEFKGGLGDHRQHWY